ncbi:receptor-like protein 6 [Carex rostrata]
MTFVALLSISLLLFSLSIKTTTLSQAQCLSDQRDALIQFKHGFNKKNQLHSWNSSTDCCIWDGIKCDDQTGMVTAISLADMSISGELNPALFNLSSLQYLDLSFNNFYNITLPQTGFERLGNLTHLDLSYSGFAGEIPIGISSLKHLISLDLSDNHYGDSNTLYLHGTNLKTLLSNLTKLQGLRLDGVDISLNGSEWGDAVSQVGTTLVYLYMVNCGLRGILPNEIFYFTNLTHLDLSFNSMLTGKLPELTKQSFLQYMFLSSTNLTGPFPNSFENLQYLLEFRLSDSDFYGEIPPSIANLTRLLNLDFSSNRLTGTIPMSLFSHPSLELLNLNDNQLSGCLHEFSNGSSVLESIDLNSNNLQGQLPISIFKSLNLVNLNLESNHFNGTFNLDIIKHNKKLDVLYLSNNNLSIIEGKNHNDSFYASFPQMKTILLASCNLKKFPSFLSFQTKIDNLDLSNNSLAGDIPLSICNVPIRVLVLSYNNLTGTIPPCLLEAAESREVLNLRSNKLSGTLPRNISEVCKFRTINLSRNRINGSLPKLLMNCHTLEVMDVGNNQIVDRFPFWFGNLGYLRVLVLESNKFYGTMSNMEAKAKTNNSYFAKLQVLDLSSNRFKGIIPKIVFENMKALVPYDDFSEFDPSDEYGYYEDSITVTSKGQEMEMQNSLDIFCSFDLANNKFWGEIPEEIGQLKSLLVLNLSHNALTGIIPTEFGNLVQLESLDLSSNLLSGHIPQELSSLTALSSLNLSYNNLVGDIPKAHQFSTFSNVSYLGNPGLCGSPLSVLCAASSNHGFDKCLPSKLSNDIIELSVSIGLGLGVGFTFVIWTTISWENGRRWFNLIIDKFYFRYFY